MKNKLAVSLVIIAQVVIVGILGFQIYQKKTKVLGQMNIVPVPKESMVKVKSSSLTNFYELQPEIVMKDDPRIPIAASYTINKDSLNERYNYSVEKPDNTYRFITIGDSFTFGAYVPTKDNWTELLEDILRTQCNDKKYEVINLGVGGYDIQYAAERYKIRGEKYDPDLIIWLLKDDDFDFPNELYLKTALKYENEMADDPQYKEKYIDKGEYYPAWRKAAWELFETHSRDELYAISTAYLNEFIQLYDRKLLLALLPVVRTETQEAISKATSDHVLSFEIPTNIYKDNTLHYVVDLHPTVKGHAQIAQDMFNYLTSSSLVSCN